MTERLNQILAVEKNTKNEAENKFTEIHHLTQRSDALNGFRRTYKPRKDGDEVFPTESKRVQFYVEDQLKKLSTVLSGFFDITARKDRTNCEAFADIVLDDKTIVPKVPATHLLFLEKKLTDLRTTVQKLATLDPAEDWQPDPLQGGWRTEPTKTVKTRKVSGWEVVVAATPEHPAQTKETSRDEVVGDWEQVKFSGAVPTQRITELLSRIEKMIRAVKYARQQANNTPVVDLKTGEAVLGYIFG